MDFILNQEQAILRHSVERFCTDLKALDDKAPLDLRAQWTQFAEMGLLGVAFDEAHGGSGGGGVELSLVAEQVGRNLLKIPFVSSIVVAASLVQGLAPAAIRDELLPAVAEGRVLLAAALLEPGARYDLAARATEASADGAFYVLNGRKSVVLAGGAADFLLVSARIAGSDGVSLFLVPGDAAGLERRVSATLDGRETAEIGLAGVRVAATALLGGAGAALPAIAAAVERGNAALVSEAVGAMGALFDVTVEYLRTRKQFGQQIGKFQALQHRLVDMKVNLEMTRSLAGAAAMVVDVDDAGERARIVSAARVQAARAGRSIGQQAIQMHGAMGMTDELAVGHLVKRLMVLAAQQDDAGANLERFMAYAGYSGAAA